MRLFVGIKLDDSALNKVKNICNNLSKNGFRGNFTNYFNIHLTLLFLGEVDEAKKNEVICLLNKINFSNFNLKFNKITNLKDMIVLEVEKDDALMKLQKEIEESLGKVVKIQARKYYPHITLIREWNKANFKNEFRYEVCFTSKVNCFYLFSSERINGKIIYRSLYEKGNSEDE